MKTMLRNLLCVVRLSKIATGLNVSGLAVAFASFIVILMQVHYEQQFDKMHPKSDRIFKIDLVRHGTDAESVSSIHTRAFVDALSESSPHIESITLYNPFVGDVYVTVGDDNNQKGFRENVITCYPGITDIFGFEFIEGAGSSLQEPEKVIIPESMARRFFGDSPAIGQVIHAKEMIWTKDVRNLTVGGVYADFPDNTQIQNAIYGTIDNTMKGDWMSGNFICYMLLQKGKGSESFTDELNAHFDFSPLWNPNGEKLSIQLVSLADIHYSKTSSLFKTGNPNTVKLLVFIALLIMIIAAINFTNFSIGQTPVRIKSMNTQKVFGCSNGEQRKILLAEAMGIAFVAWLLGLVLVWMLCKNDWLSFFEADLRLANHIPLVFISCVIALLIGFIAGIYPAWYMTSFQPAMVLKGNFATSATGRFLRTGLVGFQYAISIGLIIAAIFVQLQRHYMSTFDLGFDKEQVAVVELNGDFYKNNRELYVNELKVYPGIDAVAFSKQKIGARDGYTTYGLSYEGEQFYSYVLEVSPSFPEVMGIPVLEGRDFLPADEQPGQLMFMFNKPLQEHVGMEPGSLIEMSVWEMSGRTAGIIGDLKFTSLRQGQDDISFMINPHVALPVSYIKLKPGTNIQEAVAHIRKVVATIDPTYPFELEFYDTIFDQLYRKEVAFTKMITIFSILAIIISMVGVFGLILFETQFRRKEIALRRILGSDIRTILTMFNKMYVYIIVIGFMIAAPITYYAMTRWLENFAYKTPLYGWVFIVAFLFVTFITVLTITIQSWRAVNANPVESIKAE